MESMLIGLAIIAICYFVLKIPRFSSSNGQLQVGEAEVISRRSERPSSSLPTQWGGRMNYLVTFSLNGEMLELNATNAQYVRLVEGSSVQLRWQENNIVDFEIL